MGGEEFGRVVRDAFLLLVAVHVDQIGAVNRVAVPVGLLAPRAQFPACAPECHLVIVDTLAELFERAAKRQGELGEEV